jgi:transcriptional regulator with XRE-family HTH domain
LTEEISGANYGTMRFSEWFADQRDLTQQALAERLDVTQGRIAQLLSDDLPSFKLALRIQDVTRGAVSPNDWAPPRRVRAE